MKDVPEIVFELIEASKKHEQYREKECINMIASEGIKSPAVCHMLDMSHDLATTTPWGTLRNVPIRAKST